MCREIIGLYCKKNMHYIITLFGKNAKFVHLKVPAHISAH